jgi:hypothetical protein
MSQGEDWVGQHGVNSHSLIVAEQRELTDQRQVLNARDTPTHPSSGDKSHHQSQCPPVEPGRPQLGSTRCVDRGRLELPLSWLNSRVASNRGGIAGLPTTMFCRSFDHISVGLLSHIAACCRVATRMLRRGVCMRGIDVNEIRGEKGVRLLGETGPRLPYMYLDQPPPIPLPPPHLLRLDVGPQSLAPQDPSST